MTAPNLAQTDFFEQKIAELEAQRQRYVDRIGTSLTSDRTCYLYIDAFDDEIRRCRRSLAWVKENES